MPNTTSGATCADKSAAVSNLLCADRSHPSIEEIPMWFDVLRDLAARLGDEADSKICNLVWAIEKLAEKYSDDAQQLVSVQLSTTKGGAA